LKKAGENANIYGLPNKSGSWRVISPEKAGKDDESTTVSKENV
jgi:hypothetical protein